ncbi:cytotoxic necrotizing factor Rho-activating domain-containing protein [Proteus mirabilis]|uniref:cytotoxic necrotizing factor Rho-activating domain-containing protein n=1 Tax=Proteus mirabilis TaxID=584 RepID=UPI002348FDFB|nr:cytotoxic necrotizing factor Rho-activating domain-containing protein [Proteus mirabilis]MDC5886305.1 cytotoxic necrotizing factor Rho-activating domain-containing protein [Proteus mirabilis]MDC5903902.1 cytotoxic necrotizing factor Rho-activating domain-containing protein [Proteus mirabilis]MDC5907452.1 cytotoxic necrotizing factor Rho-activating domain-containing protein [Proteus mirabilis]MDC5921559.1 cytotoxic necrotizing factor Rho-activating domain-containing protein [Proteus mirabilis
MKILDIFNSRHIYAINNPTTVTKSESNSQFFSNVKNAENSPITMIRSFFKNQSCLGGAEKKVSMRELINASYVVPDSGHTAKANFVNTARFNGVITEVTASEKRALEKDNASVINGNIRPLIGKGIVSSVTKNDNTPIVYDFVRSDREYNLVSRNISNVNHGIESYNGDKIKSAEIIPGTPLGNYYNKQTFDKNLNIIQLDNGNCGTVGFRFDLRQIMQNKPLLIHAGELSGCTVVYAFKDNYFYAFHSGKPGNDQSAWTTAKEGSQSIINSHQKIINSTINIDKEINNELLSSYLAQNFDISMMSFCGHGESITNKRNVFLFDYNKPSILIGEDKARVGNSMAIITNENGKIKINMLSDDITINKKTLQTESIRYIISNSVEKS